ncbi:MAG TPA: VCBS repeat-containing protein [Steroidobacteraceae bacterium]|nr:VCBS repeat-containing protein [Steroidobacteraceae bacterium]
MFRTSATRSAARLWVLLPVFALASCGGNDTGAIITVPNSVVVADLRHAGVMDIVEASAQIDETGLTQKPGLVSVILNSTAAPGNFAASADYATNSSPPSGLAVGDLTGNGSQDLVVANITTGTLAVFMETSPTSGTYPTKATTINVGGQPNDVQIADLNGDGLPDLIVADNTGKVTYLIQNASSPGTFATGVSLPITNPAITAEGSAFSTRAISVAVGDLNGDGLPDLAVTSFDINGDYGQLTLYFQDPAHPGTFLATPQVINTFCEPSQVKIADIDKDGSNDLAIACQGLGANSDLNALSDGNPLGQIAVAESNYGALIIMQNASSPGTFAAPIGYPSINGAISLAIGDLNMDGLPDIAMVSLYPQGQGEVAVLLQDATNAGTFPTIETYSGSGQPVSIVIGDMNNDGLPDLVIADATTAVWFENVVGGAGTFNTEGQVGFH